MKAEDDEDVKPTFIERVIGIRSRKKNKEDVEDLPDNIVKFSDENNNDDMPELSGDELDIPSFLRRK